MSLPTKEDIAKKKGLHHHICVCGNDVYSKYNKPGMLCEACSYAKRIKDAKSRQRVKRIAKLLEKEVDTFKTKLVINKLKDIQKTCDIDRDELERIFITYA